MRKLLAAFLVAALSLLSFTAPAQAEPNSPVYVPADLDRTSAMTFSHKHISGMSHPVLGGTIQIRGVSGATWGEIGSSVSLEVRYTFYVKDSDGEQEVTLEPSYSDEWLVPEWALGKRLRAVATRVHPEYEFESIEIPTSDGERWSPEVRLPPTEIYPNGLIGIEGESANSSRFILVGNELNFSLDGDLPEGSSLECYWYKGGWHFPLERIHSCNEPLVLKGDMIGSYIHAHVKIMNPRTADIVFPILVDKEIRYSSKHLEMHYETPSSIYLGKNGNYKISVTSDIGVPLAGPMAYMHVSGVERNPASASAEFPHEFSYSPGEWDTVGVEHFLEVELSSRNYDRIVNRKSLGVLQPAQLANLDNPVIDLGDRYVRVAAVPWVEGEGVKFSYEWLMNDNVVAVRDSGSNFRFKPDQSGNKVQLRLRISSSEFAETVLESNVVYLPKERLLDSEPVKILGKPQVGETLTVKVAEYSGENVTFTYQWMKNGKPISGATQPKLKITSDLAYAEVSVVIDASAEHFISGKATSESVTIAPLPLIPLKMSQPAQVVGRTVAGSTLVAQPGVWDVPKGTKLYRNYEWYIGSERVRSGKELILTKELVGKKITLVELVQAQGYQFSQYSLLPVTIGKSTASVKAKLSKKSIKANGSSKLAVTVKTPGVAKPTGKVTVKVGKKTYKATLKASHKGKVSLALKGLKAGKGQAVKVKFTPTGKTAKAVKSSKNTTVAKIAVKKISKTVAR